ncbi:MAG: GvpL/GvpF family gas vesicle protein [Solirubrobacteraceae bacterium]
MSATATHPTYVYGVLSAEVEPPEIEGIGGAPLQEVRSEGLAALVSDLGEHELALGREEMTTHARVLERALERGTVLPMRFGVVMDGEEAVRRALLDAHRTELAGQLREMTGKVELRLRAVYEETRLMDEVVRENADVAQLRESLRDAPEDATYYGRIQLGEMVAAAAERKREQDAGQILDRLNGLALATEVGESTNPRIVLNASFLAEREQMGQFDAVVDDIGREQAGRMRLKYTGPLPPHSFVRLQTEEA